MAGTAVQMSLLTNKFPHSHSTRLLILFSGASLQSGPPPCTVQLEGSVLSWTPQWKAHESGEFRVTVRYGASDQCRGKEGGHAVFCTCDMYLLPGH